MQTLAPRRIIDADAEAVEPAPVVRTEFKSLYYALYGDEGGSIALARALGVHKTTVFQWLQGKRPAPEAILEYMRRTVRDVEDLTKHVEDWAIEMVEEDGEDPHVVAVAFKRIGHRMSKRPSVRTGDDVVEAE